MFLHITNVRYSNDYKIEVSFNDGRKGLADLSPIVTKGVFQRLKDLDLFSKVTVDREIDTIVWPGGFDIAPEYVYYLAFKEDENQGLQEKFKEWGYV